MKIAIVVVRYGLDIVGGAEYHARVVAEHLKKYYDIEVLTTCAKDYHTWKNYYPEGVQLINDVPVRRFRTAKIANPNRQNVIAERVFYHSHSKNDELAWIDELGPICPGLIHFISDHKDDYNWFVFFTFRYYPSYYGIQEVGEKAFIAPLAENDPALNLTTTRDIFERVRGIIYNAPEERNLILNKVDFDEDPKLWDVVGCGIDTPSKIPDPVKGAHNKYMLYLGRIEGSKGCYQLFEYYQKLSAELPEIPDLILAGFDAIGVPKHPKIKYLGFISEHEKWALLNGATFLVMPSPYESLSLVTLEALACGTPVLVNGQCEVLKGHCLRSNAGLWYRDYDEFKECIQFLLQNGRLRGVFGGNGERYVEMNYTWKKVEEKYFQLLGEI